ncbi:hypothetical protein OROMI_004854 [Orobanche minor]
MVGWLLLFVADFIYSSMGADEDCSANRERYRLAAGEWFTTRVSACGLFHIAYLSAPDMLKSELRSIYSQLCQDDMPMVIRSAATKLGKFAATVEAAHLKTDIMSMFEVLTQDDQDSVRLLAVEACAALGKLLEPQDCVAHILPVIVIFSQVHPVLVMIDGDAHITIAVVYC